MKKINKMILMAIFTFGLTSIGQTKATVTQYYDDNGTRVTYDDGYRSCSSCYKPCRSCSTCRSCSRGWSRGWSPFFGGWYW